MRAASIAQHLRPYGIRANRATTINHAFAAAIAPNDDYAPETVREAVKTLGQDPDDDLLCVYCGSNAETWDHVFATVEKREFSGHGHRLGNLVPCCKPCNSRKGNKEWNSYLNRTCQDDQEYRVRYEIISGYLRKYAVVDEIPGDLPEYKSLREIRKKILTLMTEADVLAARIRKQVLDAPQALHMADE